MNEECNGQKNRPTSQINYSDSLFFVQRQRQRQWCFLHTHTQRSRPFPASSHQISMQQYSAEQTNKKKFHQISEHSTKLNHRTQDISIPGPASARCKHRSVSIPEWHHLLLPNTQCHVAIPLRFIASLRSFALFHSLSFPVKYALEKELRWFEYVENVCVFLVRFFHVFAFGSESWQLFSFATL